MQIDWVHTPLQTQSLCAVSYIAVYIQLFFRTVCQSKQLPSVAALILSPIG